MAYSKHTWVARQGTDLSKFTDTISGNTLNLVSAATVTEPGTPISASWLNEMEQVIADGNAIVLPELPTTSTVGAVGQIGVYNGAAFVCVAAQNNVYTWVGVGCTHTEENQTSSTYETYKTADVYADGRAHLYGRVKTAISISASLPTALGALYVYTNESISFGNLYPFKSNTNSIKSITLGACFTPLIGGTAAVCGIESYPVTALTLAKGIAPKIFFATITGFQGGTLEWSFDIWGINR